MGLLNGREVLEMGDYFFGVGVGDVGFGGAAFGGAEVVEQWFQVEGEFFQFLEGLAEFFRRDVFFFEVFDAVFQIVLIMIWLAMRTNGAFYSELVDDFVNQQDFFQVIDLFKFSGQAENLAIFADDFITKAVEGGNFDVIGGGADNFQKSFAHGSDAGFGEGQTEDVVGINLGVQEDFGDADGQDLGFSGSSSGDGHDWAFDGVDGGFLFSV